MSEKNLLRHYRGQSFYDAGPFGDPGDHKLEIIAADGETILHCLFFSDKDVTSLNKAIEKAKEWVNKNIEHASKEETPRFSDEELLEFKTILENKLEAAEKELLYLEGMIRKKEDHGKQPADDNTDAETEQMAQMASRQKKYIEHLKQALVRIENKTYGICRITGKLIDKTRLRAVPHATLSIEAKALVNKEIKEPVSKDALHKSKRKSTTKKKEELPAPETAERKCRVCGCTQDNCQQCIDKTGSACHWVEDDLCSACVEVPAIEVTDHRASAGNIDKDPLADKTIVNVNFFSHLVDTIPQGLDITIRIQEKNGKLTVGLFPSLKSKQKPVNMVGTPEELDEAFFNSIIPEVKNIPGIISNIEEVKKSSVQANDKSKVTKPKPRTRIKHAMKKKSSPAKPKAKPKPATTKKNKNKPPVKPATTPGIDEAQKDAGQETPVLPEQHQSEA